MKAGKRIAASGQRYTAVVTVADVLAFGVMEGLRLGGRRVPEDVSIVGYDGVPISDYLVPRLATVRQNTQHMAERGVDILLRGIERRGQAPVHEVVPFQLIPGESVARLEA